MERALRSPSARYRPEMAAGRGRNVSPHDLDRSEKSEANFCSDLGRGCIPDRRRGKNLETDKPRVAFAIHSRSTRGGWTLRASDRDASVETEHALHAKTLGR